MIDWFNKELFISEAKKLSINLSDEQLTQFQSFGDAIIRVNQSMNLTRVPPEEFQVRHFLDSLSIVLAAPFVSGDSVLDIGSGAGFPGIPLAITYPEISFTLIDSLNKRIKFLNDCISLVGLQNAAAFHRRAEDEPDRYSKIVVRAVTNLETLCRYFNRLLKKGGVGIALKGGRVEEEIKVLPKPLRERVSVKEVLVPGDKDKRVNYVVLYQG